MSRDKTFAYVGESADLQSIGRRLLSRFSPPLQAEEVDRCLRECIATFEDAPVRNYLSVLIERAAADRLRSVVHDMPQGSRLNAPVDVPDVRVLGVRTDRRATLGGVGWSPPRP